MQIQAPVIVLGYDPGGWGNNGVAILRVAEDSVKQETETVNSVDAAIDWFRVNLAADVPVAAGIDTLLCWQTDTIWRGPDEWLKEHFPDFQNHVASPNSLSGSMVLNGMAFALRVRGAGLWPEIHLNETHPKVLSYALTQSEEYFTPSSKSWLLTQVRSCIDRHRKCLQSDETQSEPEHEFKTDHEWDALISAWATYQGVRGFWKEDLMRHARKPLFPAGPATYYWPSSRGQIRLAQPLQRIENRLPINAFVICNGSKNSVKRADAHRLVGGNGDAMQSWLRRLQDDVAADLIDLHVSPTAAERGRQIVAAQVTREFHPRARISSRTRCRRIPAGFGRSK